MKKDKGVLTLEAALMVPIFVFIIFFILQFIRIVYIYDTVQTNLYNTAKFINGYSYLAQATGLNDFKDEANANLTSDELLNRVNNIFDAITEDPTKPPQDIVESGLSALETEINGLVDDLIKKAISGTTEGAVDLIVSQIAEKSLQSDFIATIGPNYKKKLMLDSEFKINNSESEISLGSDGKIKLVVEYEVDTNVPFFKLDKPLKLKNQVVIKNFTGK